MTDSALEELEWSEQDAPWFTVLAASSKRFEGSEHWAKERNVGVHYMKNWEWQEIVAAFWYRPFLPFARTPLLTAIIVRSMENPGWREEEIETLYKTFLRFGPVARTCLGRPLKDPVG